MVEVEELRPHADHMSTIEDSDSVASIVARITLFNAGFEEHKQHFHHTQLHGTVGRDFDCIENTLDELKHKFTQLKTQLKALGSESRNGTLDVAKYRAKDDLASTRYHDPWALKLEEYKRYGRQLIMPEVGMPGQLRLKASSVLIVGAGGLGCPAAAYLAGAGVGKIGIMDGDIVEVSNLHRQVMHNSAWVGKSKAVSLGNALRLINPLPRYEIHPYHLVPENSAIAAGYSMILDCTDRPSSRYLISDMAVVHGIPLVSASALRTEGQIMVLNDPPVSSDSEKAGPCYRCIFPRPPPPESVQSCGEGGILGPVVGVMGVLQALEAVKVIMRPPDRPANPPSLIMFSAYGSQMFRTMRIRGKNPTCSACSSDTTITRQSLESGSQDYMAFCGALEASDVLAAKDRVSVMDFASMINRSGTPVNHTLVDVREKPQFELCNMLGSVHVPFSLLRRWKNAEEATTALSIDIESHEPIYVVCRLGNDSQATVNKLRELGIDRNGARKIMDIKGGWEAWRKDIDQSWPEY
ncbi:hypothetical protein FH972_020972 [Carpinus fangiana]|uniref:Adenylyltransferase and sulfurtransferase MOCS3 n=1 Tax=Carpinus fangiana TaxID=176857 RepID=A0A5N6KN22_9ROSI|nr:hypothetical protein FH972_020972 [Carpinus fangiana]